ncbi:hypothetical protein SAMN05444274_1081, partial [Mariniphaga anaerophila]
VSYAPTIDKLKTKEERRKAYAEALTAKPDIVESDRPVEVWPLVASEK